MNYIYDILINLQDKLYDFYDWNLNDDIIHIRKAPIFKIKSDDLYNLEKNKIKLNSNTMLKVKNRTEIFSDKNVKIINYLAIFTDSKDTVVIKFDDSGNKESISKFFIDDYEEIIEMSEHMDFDTIDYQVLENINNNLWYTRKELKVYEYIISQFVKDNYNKLKYLYYECFDEKEKNYDKIVSRLKYELINNYDNLSAKIFKILKMSSQKTSK